MLRNIIKNLHHYEIFFYLRKYSYMFVFLSLLHIMSEYKKSKERRRSMFKSIVKGTDSGSKGKRRDDNSRKRSQTPSSPSESSGKKTRTSIELEESDEEVAGNEFI
jgi:hypothetical protein